MKIARVVSLLITSSWLMLTSGLSVGCQPTTSPKNTTVMNNQTPELNHLFQKLKTAQSSTEIELLQADIWRVWLETGQPELDQQMAQGITAMSDQEYDEAIEHFTRIIEEQPDYAEGWNKRATAYYLRGNYKASIDDIEQTLAREARHFGALSGLVSIYRTVGDDRAALRTLEKLATIMPTNDMIRQQIQQLRGELGIRNI